MKGFSSLFTGTGFRRSLILLTSFVGLMAALLLRPELWEETTAPAQIANAYFTEHLSSAKTLLFPSDQDNLRETAPQGDGYFVMDVAMNSQGLHHLEVEVRNQRGEKLNALVYDAVPSVQDGFVHTIVGKIGSDKGARTVHLYDRLSGSDRTPIGVFNVLTPKNARGKEEPTLSVKNLSPEALVESAAVLRSIDAAQSKKRHGENGETVSGSMASDVLMSAMRLVEQVTGLETANAGDYTGEDTLCWLPISPRLASRENIKDRFPHFNIPLKLDDRTFRLDGVGPYTSWLQARMAARQLTPGGESQVLCIHGDGKFQMPERTANTAFISSGQGSYWYLISATASSRQLSRIQGVLDTIGTPFNIYEVPVTDKRAAFVLMGPFGAQKEAQEQVQVAREHLGSTGIWLHGGPSRVAQKKIKPPMVAQVESVQEITIPIPLSAEDPMAKFMALLGRYADEETAKRLVSSLKKQGIPARLKQDVSGSAYQVYMGPYASWLGARMGLREARYRMGLEGGEVTQWERPDGLSQGRFAKVAQIIEEPEQESMLELQPQDG
ncbi:SPOR domain-containing protein [Magnetococcus sp. PR-3]|uniref:SPOR domain-containing protein n=1 Tax=Magnetococcus sp. PR-3 TaxID=3120355 RepID=UPI002FCE107B